MSKGIIDRGLADRFPLQILVAEDNPVNMKLAVRLLEKMGYAPEKAINGYEVLERLQEGTFDIILMDVQMPGMDGLEATKRIRETISQNDRPIIIAMTANAMKGDRELCLRTGMNDYLSKPIKVELLQQTLQRWAEQFPTDPTEGIAAHAADNKSAIDEEVFNLLKEIVGTGEDSILEELIASFRDQSVEQLAKMERAIEEGDVHTLRHETHSLKGAGLNLGAKSLADICSIIEARAEVGDLSGLSERIPAVRESRDAAVQMLHRLMGNPSDRVSG